MSELNALIVAGYGEADSYRRDLFEARIRATVRYADPAAWITATAVAIALAGAGELLAQWRHEIGMIAVSDLGPGSAMAEVELAGTKGYSSPDAFSMISWCRSNWIAQLGHMWTSTSMPSCVR